MSTSPSLSSTPFDIPSNSSPSSTKCKLSSSDLFTHSSASSKYAPEIVALKRHICTVESLIYDIILQPPYAPPPQSSASSKYASEIVALNRRTGDIETLNDSFRGFLQAPYAPPPPQSSASSKNTSGVVAVKQLIGATEALKDTLRVFLQPPHAPPPLFSLPPPTPAPSALLQLGAVQQFVKSIPNSHEHDGEWLS
jgi:hypothetical protein